jgi:hypothetical protein
MSGQAQTPSGPLWPLRPLLPTEAVLLQGLLLFQPPCSLGLVGSSLETVVGGLRWTTCQWKMRQFCIYNTYVKSTNRCMREKSMSS